MRQVEPPRFGFNDAAIEAEQAIFGCLMRFPSTADYIAAHVSRTYFHDDQLGRAVGLLCDLHAARQIDIGDAGAVVSCLRKAGILAAIGGSAAVHQALKSAPLSAANVQHFVAEVIRFSRLRRLAAAAEDVIRQVDHVGADPEQIAELASIAADGGVTNEAIPLCDMLRSLADSMDAHLRAPEQSVFVKTGIDGLDSITGGMANGELIVVGAGTSVGKTALGVQIAIDAAKRGNRTLVLSLEMQEIQLAHRIAAMELDGLSLLDLRTGTYSRDHAAQVRQLADQMAGVPFAVQPAVRATMQRIRSYARTHRAISGLSLLVVDYLQLIRGNQKLSRFDRISDTSNELKNLAAELDLPVIALAQLNRDGAAEPTIETLRGSGDIEQDADQIWLIHRDDKSGETKLIIGKNRQGPKDVIPLQFNGERCRFREA